MNTAQLISLILSVASPLLPLIVGYQNRRKILWVYVLTGFAFDILLMTVKRGLHYNIFPLANLYVLVDFIILTVFYYYSTAKQFKFFLPVAVLLAVSYIIQTIGNGVEARNGAGAAYIYVAYLLYALLGFYSISKKQTNTNILNSMFFWANVAVLIGSSGRVILFLFEDYLIANQDTRLGELWIVYKVFNIVVNLLFAISLSKKHE